MLNKLRTRLILFILGGTILSIILVSIITNITLSRKFDTYMHHEQENRIEEVIEVIQQAYSTNEGWTGITLENLQISPLVHNFDIVIKDVEDRIIFESRMENNMLRMHRDMMRRMGSRRMSGMHHTMMNESLRQGDYTVDTYTLQQDGQPIGMVELGYIGPFTVSERDVAFMREINNAIIYAAVIAILISIGIGYYFSNVFSKPILRITKAANDIRRGDLGTTVEINNKTLELQELSQSINHLSSSLKQQEILRKRLTSDISHELRTPLTILQSHIEAISDGIWEPTPDKLDICKNEVIRLMRLVEQLKYLNNIEKHQMTLDSSRYNLTQDLQQIIEGFHYQFQNKGIKVNTNIKEAVIVEGDRDKMKQVIINLITNALKFTENRGTVDIQLTKEKEKIKIIVKDTGIGIEKKDLPYIFERFYRTDESRNRKTGGSGIGLTITKTIVDAHGGSITVESEKNKGSSFFVELPIESKSRRMS
ncbi:MAG: HAMP domain-containing protein [Clostridiaceae bacterium]|nr:HAMP domain-containing protein [Clostridiaceae bacterium]